MIGCVMSFPTGSSPLARGTHEAPPPRLRPHRFIPARAGNTSTSRGGREPRSVHPRSRGEHGAPAGPKNTMTGSSPLARGTPGVDAIGYPLRRFIPARAGNTGTGCAPPNHAAVHPRSRGEHPMSGARIPPANGSSPLARGTPSPRSRPQSESRFIPARAGNTGRGRRRMVEEPVHPRSRGEHLRPRDELPDEGGSSPLARGTRAALAHGPDPERFIPARAGNTARLASSSCWVPVHPRSRGEHDLDLNQKSAWFGSSPLARGTPEARGAGPEPERFIPARAGNTRSGSPCRARWWVHPRSRGEHRGRLWPARFRTGSSPLARGTRAHSGRHRSGSRFIPARAGNTCPSRGSSRRAPVHPRSRGEHASRAQQGGRPAGSSPLARGTPAEALRHLVLQRFIPARAGNTSSMPPSPSPAAVHPRSRGEHMMGGGQTVNVSGSSPLARGTPERLGVTDFREAVHPRSRGEHLPLAEGLLTLPGSSPLARGTRMPAPARSARPRFIPARAGNT